MVVYDRRMLIRRQSESDGSLSSGESVHGQVAPTKCQWSSCSDWFNTLEDLALHVGHCHASAGKGGLFYCGWRGCSRGERGFNARYKMLVHVRTHTNEKPHQCFICDKSFSRAENLKIHARSHTGERPYVCPVDGCGKAYSNSSDRFKHTRTHSIDKPYLCKVPGCPKRYTDPSSLRKHVKTYRHFSTTVTPSIVDKTDFVGCTSINRESDTNWRLDDALSNNSDMGISHSFPLSNEHHQLSFFPTWPSLFHWYLPPQHTLSPSRPIIDTGVYYLEQETPLDLTTPIRLQHRI